MLLAASPFFIGAGYSLASGLGTLADVVLFVSLMWVASQFGGFAAGALLSVLPVRLPFRLIGKGIALMVLLMLIFKRTQVQSIGAAAIAGCALLAGYAAGSGIWLAFRSRQRRLLAGVHGLIGTASLLLFHGWLFAGATDGNGPGRAPAEPVVPVAGMVRDAADPSARGPHRVVSFTYGSGTDRYRPEFAGGAAIRTRTVDATALIDDWDWSRRWLWNTDPAALPLNGRVWLPAGDGGPYPLVLIVHGNHGMADYSDEGYGYLGELLASRGYAVVSVDANFLNHSTWEGNLGDLSENITIRAWLILQHVLEIETLSQTEGNLLSGKADLDRIALIGHSRGGQAAMLAAEFDRFFAAEHHADIRIGRDFGIDAVIALAPTDFLVDRRSVSAGNVNYLLLQGAADADVTRFPGDRQFSRVGFQPEDGDFYLKASLYIQGANHGQFNEDWGRRDLNLPAAWLLNGRDLLAGDDQRQIAKVYVSAFLDTVFGKSDRYLPMFRDYRQASQWLPPTGLVGRYGDSRFAVLADFDEDRIPETGRLRAVLEAEGDSAWTERDLTDRGGGSRMNRVAEFAWEGDEASLVITLPAETIWPESQTVEAVGLALADLSPEEGELDVVIELETREGTVVRMDLDEGPPVPGPVETRFVKAVPGNLLEEAVKDGALRTAGETVLQSYYVPLEEEYDSPETAVEPEHAEPEDGVSAMGPLTEEGDQASTDGPMGGSHVSDCEPIEPEDIGQIRILLEKEGGGTVLLDDIGLYLTHS